MTIEATGGSATGMDDLCRYAERLTASVHGPLRSIRVRAGDLQVELEWSPPESAALAAVADPEPAAAGTAADGTTPVTAPLVGTFYHSPSPDEPPFVRVGDVVTAGQQVGIVEAMKLMNPVVTESSGRVVDIPVPDATPVEYGEPLIVLAPA
ncbi:acetyl-CoA carboxylase biotin carboxyl carrier protein [Actinoplanes sp. G11-F43]|uniref:acetyl-CoA carboxylase biotin carboxyl carrier protein n=1 Tax=Actinoplanes sp. G11-F43 TaxID=3424130 RepID=UPI003D3563B4